MQDDGNLVVYTYNLRLIIAIWAPGSGNRPASQGPFYAVLNNGNLIIYRANSIAIWHSNTYGKGIEPHMLVMRIDGNLVIYDGRDQAQ